MRETASDDSLPNIANSRIGSRARKRPTSIHATLNTASRGIPQCISEYVGVYGIGYPIIIRVALLRTVATRTEDMNLVMLPLAICASHSHILGLYNATPEKHTTGAWTNRGLDAYAASLVHAFPVDGFLEEVLGSPALEGSHKAVLELGCGEAHALLDIQHRFRSVHCECMNSASYALWCLSSSYTAATGTLKEPVCGMGPVMQPPDKSDHPRAVWKTTAASFGIPDLPKYPHVTFANYGKHNPLPFRSSQYDLVMAINAFGFGKLTHPDREFPTIVAETIRILKVGGIALLQLGSILEPGALLPEGNLSSAEFDKLLAIPQSVAMQRSAQMRAAKFPFRRAASPGKYVPLHFHPCARVTNTTCVDLFLFVGPPGYIWFVIRKVRSVWMSESNGSQDESGCTAWTIHRSLKNLSSGFGENFLDTASRLVQDGTSCAVE